MSVSFSVPTLMCGIVLLSDPGAKGSAPDWLVSDCGLLLSILVESTQSSRTFRRVGADADRLRGFRRRSVEPTLLLRSLPPVFKRNILITKCRQEIFMDAFMLVGAGVCRRQHRGCS